MEKVLKLLKNNWFKLGVSLLGGAYSVFLCYFVYIAFFYKITYTESVKFAVIYSVFSTLTCLVFIYTRKSAFTKVFCMANVVLFFPALLLGWGNWPLLALAAFVTIFGFFACKMNDTLKTVLGTIFLLVYIVGGIVFFILMNMLRVDTIDTVISSGASPSGDFRYYVLDVQNNSSGKIAVYVQPNGLDADNGFMALETTIKKLVKQSNKPAEADCEWRGKDLLINGEAFFSESDYSVNLGGVTNYLLSDTNWTYTYFSIEYPLFDLVSEAKEIVSGVLGGNDEEETEPEENETE